MSFISRQLAKMNFRTKTNHANPPCNKIIFEEYFGDRFLKENHESIQRKYIDVYWTNYYISKNYANGDLSDLQDYLNSLDKNQKYFTVCQWDDGIKNDVDGLDLFTFASGGVGDYCYALNSMPHGVKCSNKRDIIASFVGCINGRHEVREKMNSTMQNLQGVLISETIDYNSFLNILSRSVFSLCPRGYGKTSFRIGESLEAGCVPVYIYDDPWIPFSDMINFEEYGILCHIKEISRLYDKLCRITLDEVQDLINKGQEVYKEYYAFEGCYNKIINKLEGMK